MRLKGKHIAVTGATGGLGRATALALAAQGAMLALTDRDAGELRLLAQELGTLGAEVVWHAGDVREPGTHGTLVAHAMERWGVLHGWCNVAGVLGPGRIEEATPTRFDEVMHVNCMAQLVAIREALPALRAAGRASIVNVASVGALVALPMMAIYCASKAAVIGLTRAMAAELGPDIRCNAVCPGGIESPMSQSLLAGVEPAERAALTAKLVGRQMIARFALPQEIAGALVFLLSDESAFTTGAVIAADGGHSAW